MQRLFLNIIKSFLVPINFVLYFAILLYFIGYITGNADMSGIIIFSSATFIANILSGIFVTFADCNNAKKFDNLYIYGHSRNGRRR